MFTQFRGDDWTLDFGLCQWDDGTSISQGDLASATIRSTVAGFAATPTPDPEAGVRLRLEVPKALTINARPRTHKCDVEITLSGKTSTYAFELTVLPDVTQGTP